MLRSASGRARMVLLVLWAVFVQIARNWVMLRAVGVDATAFDATAALIAMVTVSQLPIGPSVGAAAMVLILGADEPGAAAAAGVLLIATGTAGALAYVVWAGCDRLRAAWRPPEVRARRGRRSASPMLVAEPALVPAVAGAHPLSASPPGRPDAHG